MRPEQFAKVFPDLQMIVTNSYNHNNESPRFRAIILTSSLMTASAYEALFDAIVNKLYDAGYGKAPKAGSKLKRSGIDYSKRAATSLFYLPCQAKATHESFFDVYAGRDRAPLDPEQWIRNIDLNIVVTSNRRPFSLIGGNRY